MKRIAFIMDPLEKLDLPWDTSLCLLRELAQRGHSTILFTVDSLSLVSGNVRGFGQRIRPLGNHRYHKEPAKEFNLSDFDLVLIRKDPPFDPTYLALTYLLEPLTKKTFVANHPRGIRNANEKLFGLGLKRFSPPTVVTADAEKILDFQERLKTDLVVKPLYEKGGKGIFLLRRSGEGRALLKRATAKGKIVAAQKFIPIPKGSGDKRILLWKGKVLGAFLRIPSGHEFRSNLSLGGRFERTQITSREKSIVKSLRPLLLKEGLFFVGIDVRGGKLIEVNVTSPAGLVELDLLYGGATARVAEDLERIKGRLRSAAATCPCASRKDWYPLRFRLRGQQKACCFGNPGLARGCWQRNF